MQTRSILVYFITYASLLIGTLLILGIDATKIIAITIFWFTWMTLLSLLHKHEHESHDRIRTRTLETSKES